jgi:hypothetical protein
MNLTDQAIDEAFARHHDLYAKTRWTIESHVGWWELALRAFGNGTTGGSADDFRRLFDDLRRFWQVFRSPKAQPPKPEAVWAILSSLDPTVRALRLRDLDAAGLPGLRRLWSVLEKGAQIKKNQDGPSVMAATKFLHFWNPSLFVIVDRGEMAEWVLAHDWIKRPIMRVAEELPDDLRRRAKYADVPLGCELRDVPAILLWGSRVVARNAGVVETFARYVQRSVPRASVLPLTTYDAAALEWLLLGLVQVPPGGVTSGHFTTPQVRLEFDLATDSASWSTGFADYPASSGGRRGSLTTPRAPVGPTTSSEAESSIELSPGDLAALRPNEREDEQVRADDVPLDGL